MQRFSRDCKIIIVFIFYIDIAYVSNGDLKPLEKKTIFQIDVAIS